MGIAVSTVVYDNVQKQQGGSSSRDAQLQAYQAAQWTAFGFGALACLLSLVFLRGVGVIGHKEEKGLGEELADEERTAVSRQETQVVAGDVGEESKRDDKERKDEARETTTEV